MLDFDLAEVVVAGDLGESRDNGKIEAAGERFARRGA